MHIPGEACICKPSGMLFLGRHPSVDLAILYFFGETSTCTPSCIVSLENYSSVDLEVLFFFNAIHL